MPNIKAMTSNRTAPYSPTARQARRRSGLGKNSIAIFMMLLVEYGLGMGVNLYAQVPAADHGRRGRHGTGPSPDQPASPLRGTCHAGAADAGGGRQRPDPRRPRLGSPGNRRLGGRLAAIVAAAISGAKFGSIQQAGASMAVAVLAGIALLACLATALMAARAAVVIPGEPCE